MFFNKYSYVYEIVKTFLKNCDKFYPTDELIDNLGWKQFIFEFRILGIKLPRQSGKTTTIKKLYNPKKDILFVPNYMNYMNNLHPYDNGNNIFSYRSYTRALDISMGKTYDVLWMEEPPTESIQNKIISLFIEYKLITPKSKIIILGT